MNDSKLNQQSPISRRLFTKTLGLGGIGLFVLGPGCNQTDYPVNLPEYSSDIHKPLGKNQFRHLFAIMETIFPNDGNGPCASDFAATNHVIAFLNDGRVSTKHKTIITERLDKFIVFQQGEETFYQSTYVERLKRLNAVMDLPWGEFWLSRLTTLCLEALLIDPIYGVNTNEVGWKWLNHQHGNPRPKEEQAYPNLLVKNGL